jgi:hypothetical protein
MVKVEAPSRISIKGQSTSGCALATAWGAFADAPEKKFPILSFSEAELGAGGGGDVAGGTAGGGGVAEASDGAAVVGTATLPLPVHPDASSKSATIAATGTRSPHRIG